MADRDELVRLYQQMADLTGPACGDCEPDACARAEYRCCDRQGCENARIAARAWGVEPIETGHPTLPFMKVGGCGLSGCSLAPHLRPNCTLHLCLTNPKHEGADYLELKAKIEALEKPR